MSEHPFRSLIQMAIAAEHLARKKRLEQLSRMPILLQPSMPDSQISSSVEPKYRCDKCMDMGFFTLNVPVGHPQFGRMLICECMAEKSSARMQAISGLNDCEKKTLLSDVYASGKATGRAARYATLLRDRQSGFLTIWGGPGNGKTMILQALVNESILAGRQAIYVVFSDLANWVRDGYRDNDLSAVERLERISRVPMLAVDEWDKVKESDWLIEFKSNIVDKRYRDALAGKSATVMAMNKNPEAVFDHMIWMLSRLHDGRFSFEKGEHGLPVPAIVENSDPDVRQMLTA